MAESDSQLAEDSPPTPPVETDLTRRRFLSKAVVAVSGMSAVAGAISPLRHLDSRDLPSLEQFLQKHYKEMTPEDKEQVFARIRAGGRAAVPRATPKIVRSAAAGRRRVRLRPEPQPLHRLPPVRPRLREGEQPVAGARDPVHPRAGDGEGQHRPGDVGPSLRSAAGARITDKYYMPVQCHQCAKPPCVKVCPVEATWQEPDGIAVIDYDWCIGCRYCEAACPYWARRFNFAEPQIPAERAQPGDGLPVQPAAARRA